MVFSLPFLLAGALAVGLGGAAIGVGVGAAIAYGHGCYYGPAYYPMATYPY
ncbi:MAG TPA: hypothetical protein VLV18_01950 [Terriglobales bacterium]|nr:hypothetical protein [Terriglobales bacterium]